jgi:hypothetical protein
MYQTEIEQLDMGINCIKKQIEDMELLMWEIETFYLYEEYDN